MTVAADMYKLLCQSLGLKSGNNGQSVSDDMIVLSSPKQIPREKITKVFEDYFKDRNITVEPSPQYPALMYFMEGEKRVVVGGVSVVQFEHTLTLCFLEESEAPRIEEVEV